MYIIKKINNLKNSLQIRYIEIRNLKLWLHKKINTPYLFKNYFNEHDIKKVAILGNNIYTDLLIEELDAAGIKIEYIIAPIWFTNQYGIAMYSEIQEQINVDAVVSTSISKEEFDNQVVISIFDILYQK